MKAKPLFPNQTVTQTGLPPSKDLIEIVQRIVADILEGETGLADAVADIAAIEAASGSGTWTPTITATIGSITTLGAVAGRYAFIGDLVFINLDIAITTNGVAAGGIQSTLPFAVAGLSVISGRELSVTGIGLTGTITTGPSILTIFNHNNTYPAGNGYRLLLSGWYERTP